MRLSPMPPQRQAAQQIPQEFPVYRITDEKGFFADDTLYPEGMILGWNEGLNPNMEPMNELAHEAMKKYLATLDGFGREKAKQDKKSYTNQLDAYLARTEAPAEDDGRRAIVIGEKPQVPLMGGKKRGRPSVLTVDLTPQPDAIKNVKGKFSQFKDFTLEKAGKDAVNKADGNI